VDLINKREYTCQNIADDDSLRADGGIKVVYKEQLKKEMKLEQRQQNLQLVNIWNTVFLNSCKANELLLLKHFTAGSHNHIYY